MWKGLIYQNTDYSKYYEVSDSGELRNSVTKKKVKLYKTPKGYLVYCGSLGHRNAHKVFRIHKAVLETFMPNNDVTKTQVNHKDGNKTNNCLSNLEWVTPKENVEHAFANKLAKPRKQKAKSVIKICDDCEIMYHSAYEAAKEIEPNANMRRLSTISYHIKRACVRGGIAHGYHWKFL